jgi:FAD-dependent urate hydroxylase
LAHAADIDTVVLGAGPYGLSVAAHLRGAGINHAVFGRQMDFWTRKMPKGMFLRSPIVASSLSDPGRNLTLSAYAAREGRELGPPVPLTTFVDYGHWFAEHAGVQADPRVVAGLSLDGGLFAVRLDDDELLHARRVVLAVGCEAFRFTPPEFDALAPELTSHALDHEDLSVFAGRRLIIVGAGQSAIEYAALASEGGADVEVLARAPSVHWLTRSAGLHHLAAVRRLLYSRSDVGPAVLSQFVAVPELFRMLPDELRGPAIRRCTRPAAAAWLLRRTEKIPINTGQRIDAVAADNGGVRLDVGGRSIHADHVLLATGYRIDLNRYRFLSSGLVGSVAVKQGLPVLRPGFESSVPGLHFVGWPAAWSYGPLMRFVYGADFAARALVAQVAAAANIKGLRRPLVARGG